jgi:hypothetical protein
MKVHQRLARTNNPNSPIEAKGIFVAVTNRLSRWLCDQGPTDSRRSTINLGIDVMCQDLTHAPQQTTAARPLERMSAEEPG